MKELIKTVTHEIHSGRLLDKPYDIYRYLNKCSKCGGTEFKVWEYEGSCFGCGEPYSVMECINCKAKDSEEVDYN